MGELVKTEPEGKTSERSLIEVAASRQLQEVQATCLVAKRFPRDEEQCTAKILKACKRMSLAEKACYAYQRASTQITGPSIRLAEVLAQAWGNIDFGVIEVEQKATESIMMSYAWDLENMTRQTKTFTVPHVRHSKKYGARRLTDPRDIYEQTANQAARRLRACILGVIPGDIVELAVDACERTLAEGGGEPLDNRIRKMEQAFTTLNVTKEMLEIRLGHVLEKTTEQELVNLRSIYTSISDNFGAISNFFEGKEDKPSAKAQAVRERLAQRRETEQPPAKEAPTTTPAKEPPGWEGPPPEDEGFDTGLEDPDMPAESDNPGKPDNPGENDKLLDPLNIRFVDGVHKGKTIKEILEKKPQYITFMSKRSSNPRIRAACAMVLKTDEDLPPINPEEKEKQRIICHINERAALIPMRSKEVDDYVAEGYNGKHLDELTLDELKPVEEFFSELSNEEQDK